MLQLETVEDFERVKKLLDNPNSQSHEYRVKDFGFCTACNRITGFEENESENGCQKECLSCHRIFKFRPEYGAGECYFSQDDQQYCYFMSERQIGPSKELERLYSRKHQKKLFREELERSIVKYKAEERKAKRKVRRLAKLRSGRKPNSSKRSRPQATRLVLDHLP